jgi:hypothetical protein
VEKISRGGHWARWFIIHEFRQAGDGSAFVIKIILWSVYQKKIIKSQDKCIIFKVIMVFALPNNLHLFS